VFRTENVGIPPITDKPNVLRLHTKPRRSSTEETVAVAAIMRSASFTTLFEIDVKVSLAVVSWGFPQSYLVF
jgi:hypothetical protein